MQGLHIPERDLINVSHVHRDATHMVLISDLVSAQLEGNRIPTAHRNETYTRAYERNQTFLIYPLPMLLTFSHFALPYTLI